MLKNFLKLETVSTQTKKPLVTQKTSTDFY